MSDMPEALETDGQSQGPGPKVFQPCWKRLRRTGLVLDSYEVLKLEIHQKALWSLSSEFVQCWKFLDHYSESSSMLQNWGVAYLRDCQFIHFHLLVHVEKHMVREEVQLRNRNDMCSSSYFIENPGLEPGCLHLLYIPQSSRIWWSIELQNCKFKCLDVSLAISIRNVIGSILGSGPPGTASVKR